MTYTIRHLCDARDCRQDAAVKLSCDAWYEYRCPTHAGSRLPDGFYARVLATGRSIVGPAELGEALR